MNRGRNYREWQIFLHLLVMKTQSHEMFNQLKTYGSDKKMSQSRASGQ